VCLYFVAFKVHSINARQKGYLVLADKGIETTSKKRRGAQLELLRDTLGLLWLRQQVYVPFNFVSEGDRNYMRTLG